MGTILRIITKDWDRVRYEYFLYLFPTREFFKKLSEVNHNIGIDVSEAIKDELWVRGMVTERGLARMGKKVKKLIIDNLGKFKIEVNKNDNGQLRELQRKGKERLEVIGRQLGFLVVSNKSGLVMINRDKGFTVISGTAWAYVYKSDGSINSDAKMPVIGYIALANGDIEGVFAKCLQGELMQRVGQLSGRRRMYLLRTKMRGRRQALKRKQP